MKIIKVYQPVVSDVDSSTLLPSFFSTYEGAKALCNGWGEVEPNLRSAVLLDEANTTATGNIWLLEGAPVRLYENTVQLERAEALKKLTSRDKVVLGLFDPDEAPVRKSDFVLRDL